MEAGKDDDDIAMEIAMMMTMGETTDIVCLAFKIQWHANFQL